MSDYVPFLKFKANEIAAIKALKNPLKKSLTPFFDFPRKEDGTTEEDLVKSIDALYRKYEINLEPLPYFYIDNYDIDDDLLINGDDNYRYILEKFSTASIVPVVGIDRSDSRNDCVFDCKRKGMITSDFIALRITKEDFESYELVEDDLVDLLELCKGDFNGLHLILDCRVCDTNTQKVAQEVVNFIQKIQSDYQFERIIVTGSSIPASIRDILEPESERTIVRREVEIARSVNQKVAIHFGDYTCVSPDYSDVTVGGGVIRRITAPKLFYPFDHNQQFIIRGGSLDSHPRGNRQYEDLSKTLTSRSFYRTAQYSFGDKYLDEKANAKGNDATPSTVPKPLINLHITYTMKDFHL
ncbi:beta family protein [Vibrio europaeus]|uniref:beta family protein n=1 Tax=Vibrio europaeus TaxID=300876 RepID=UPI0018A7A2B7|nr:hypothetical protein [Vibrio europaeus]MDC5809275.1 beta family protein [Vibrio europaeus]QPG36810.1 hypothetical protein IXK98_10680 [Vibrio europaeus]